MARSSGVIAMTGATFGVIWTLLLGTLSALVVELRKLNDESGDNDEDDESYSSGEETPDDGNPEPKPTFKPLAAPAAYQRSVTRPLLVKPTIAEIISVATSMRLVEGFYSGRTDDDAANLAFASESEEDEPFDNEDVASDGEDDSFDGEDD